MSFVPLILYVVSGFIAVRQGYLAFGAMADADDNAKAHAHIKDLDMQIAQLDEMRAATLYTRACALFLSATFIGSLGVGLGFALSLFIR